MLSVQRGVVYFCGKQRPVILGGHPVQKGDIVAAFCMAKLLLSKQLPTNLSSFNFIIFFCNHRAAPGFIALVFSALECKDVLHWNQNSPPHRKLQFLRAVLC